jgi:RNA polymerase sigma factor for flagellar operon FliA
MDKQSEDGKEREDSEHDLWSQFAARRDLETRGKLINWHLPAAQRIAAALYSRRSDNNVEFGDYLQYARIGLIEAVDRFDPARGASFGTFATYRIRGAILNGLESSSELAAQRQYRRETLQERAASLRSDAEDGDTFAQLVDIAIRLALGYVLEDSNLGREHDDRPGNDPYQACELSFLQRRLTLLIEALPERERAIIKHHYLDHMDFNEVATALGLTKGRVSQLHARALQLLREAYEQLDRFDVSY